MSFSDQIGRIVAEYPARVPRDSIEAVRRLRSRLGAGDAFPVVAVVGTNGKTATATYLARLLTASGLRTGLYVSPHLTEWTERIRLDDEPCDAEALLGALTSVHGIASSGADLADLRFFDLLTLAAERLLAEAGAAIGVFEAGIGGRLDAVRALQPRLVLLTGVAVDHTEILGERPNEILAEKLLVTPPGGTVLSFPLGDELDGLAERIAADSGFGIAWIDPPARRGGGGRGAGSADAPDLPAYLREALALALAGRRSALALADGGEPGARAGPNGAGFADIDLALPGRFELGEREGVPYLLDAAHNEAAWLELAAELRRRPGGGPATILLSVSPDKRREGLSPALRSIPAPATAIVTRHTALPAEDPERIAEELRRDGVEASAVEDVDAAIRLAFERARRCQGRVLVFGSTHLVGDVRRRLAAERARIGG